MARTTAMPRLTAGTRKVPIPYTLNFNGATHKVLKSSETAYNLGVYSIEFMVKGVAQSDKVIYGEGLSTGGQSLFQIEVTNAAGTNKIKVFIRSDDSTTLLSVTGAEVVFNNTWHHVVWTDNNGAAKMYVDGNICTTSFAYTRSKALTLNITAIGGLQRTSFTNQFVGNLSKVRVYDTELTATQVKSLANQYETISGKVINWELDGSTIVGGALTGGTYQTDTPSPARSVISQARALA